MAKAFGSLKAEPVVAAAPGAGEGVAGGCAAVEADNCAGAAGTAGVETGFAGVDGSAGFDATTLGYHIRQ
jgi:hypothetical protein